MWHCTNWYNLVWYINTTCSKTLVFTHTHPLYILLLHLNYQWLTAWPLLSFSRTIYVIDRVYKRTCTSWNLQYDERDTVKSTNALTLLTIIRLDVLKPKEYYLRLNINNIINIRIQWFNKMCFTFFLNIPLYCVSALVPSQI